jgi:serine/threonine protein kinase/tetratricopeptide (TPR) repeat protein
MEWLGKYRLLETLGDGSCGSVHKAHDSSRNRQVAILTVAVDFGRDATLKEHLESECRAIAGLKHPNIVNIHECGIEGEVFYLAMEWLPGKDLKALIAGNACFPVEQKLAILIQVAAGLDHAHARGILHRNLRPGNIHLLPDGTVKVGGFQPAAILRSQPGPGALQRKPGIYLAPEQIQDREAARQADMFSLGIVSCEFLTGTHPFHAADHNAILDNIINQTHFPTVERFPELPLGLWPILEACMAKEAVERCASMADFKAACHGLLQELAEDSELMRIELQTAQPRLRKLAGKRASPPELTKLQGSIERAVLEGEKSDYLTLNRLVTALAEHYQLLQSPAEDLEPVLTPTPIQFEMEAPSAPEEVKVTEFSLPSRRPEEASPPVPAPHPEIKAAGTPVPAVTGTSAEPFVAIDHDRSQPLAGAGGAPTTEINRTHNAPVRLESMPSGLDSQTSEVSGMKTGHVEAGVIPQDDVAELFREIKEELNSKPVRADDSLSARQAKDPVEAPTLAGVSPTQHVAADATGELSHQQSIPHQARVQTIRRADPVPQRRQEADVRRDITHAPEPVSARTPEVPYIPPRHSPWRRTRWLVAGALFMMLALAAAALAISPTGSGAVKAWLDWALPSKWLAAQPAPAPSVDPIADAIRDRLQFARRDILLEEARALRAAGRSSESKMFLDRLLEIYPAYQPAMVELSEVEAETKAEKQEEEANAPANQEDQDLAVQKLLTSAAAAIRVGNMQKARSDLDRADRLKPGFSEVATMRKRWEAKNTELAQNMAREQERQRDAARKQKADALARRTEELYRQGKYDEALGNVERQLAEDPQIPQAQELLTRTSELQHNLKAYEAAVGARKHAEALNALEKIERLNPADPNLAAFRRRAEAIQASGSASLSVFPLGENAALLLDDQPIASNGELMNRNIPAGKHKITAKNSLGVEVMQIHDFFDGQRVSIVYDVSKQIMRTMAEADRELIARNNTKKQVQQFSVEHAHGLFRGSCKGTLLVGFYDVEYRPGGGSHGFTMPFKNLKLRIEDRTAVLLFASDGREFNSFKVQESAIALSLKKLWDELKSIEK